MIDLTDLIDSNQFVSVRWLSFHFFVLNLAIIEEFIAFQ